jgi:hypothetical protein
MKSKLQYTGGVGRKKKTSLRAQFKNLLNVGTIVWQLEEIMWKSNYAQLQVKVKSTFIVLFHLNISLLHFLFSWRKNFSAYLHNIMLVKL